MRINMASIMKQQDTIAFNHNVKILDSLSAVLLSVTSLSVVSLSIVSPRTLLL